MRKNKQWHGVFLPSHDRTIKLHNWFPALLYFLHLVLFLYPSNLCFRSLATTSDDLCHQTWNITYWHQYPPRWKGNLTPQNTVPSNIFCSRYEKYELILNEYFPKHFTSWCEIFHQQKAFCFEIVSKNMLVYHPIWVVAWVIHAAALNLVFPCENKMLS